MIEVITNFADLPKEVLEKIAEKKGSGCFVDPPNEKPTWVRPALKRRIGSEEAYCSVLEFGRHDEDIISSIKEVFTNDSIVFDGIHYHNIGYYLTEVDDNYAWRVYWDDDRDSEYIELVPKESTIREFVKKGQADELIEYLFEIGAVME